MYYAVLFANAGYESCPSLFHYTNAVNENLIIKDNHYQFLMTRADCFSDREEGKHIKAVFEDACEECIQNGTIDEEYNKTLKSALDDFDAIAEEQRRWYVLSFSKQENCKYLIKNYACRDKKGNAVEGICIGIQALVLENMLEDNDSNTEPDGTELIEPGYKTGIDICLYDVLYDKCKLSNDMQALIKRMYDLRQQDDGQYTLTKKTVTGILAAYSLVYKSGRFAEEKETRLIINMNKAKALPDFICQDAGSGGRHIYLKLKDKEKTYYQIERYEADKED